MSKTRLTSEVAKRILDLDTQTFRYIKRYNVKMPRPGGPADKFGNRYETWWTINQLIRIIKGEADRLRIEDPAFPKAEFVLSIENRHEFHQAKRSHPSGKWSLSSLENENLLQAIFGYLSQDSNARFVFVSGSDVPELRELIERATQAKNLEEFESRFLDTKNYRVAFDKLKKSWDNVGTAVVYDILQCIEVRTIDERGIEDQVRQSLSLHFLSDHTEICNALLAIVEDSIHATLDRDHLVSNLESNGFRLRRIVNPSNAPILVAEVTNRYTEDIRQQLINKSSIARSESETLLVTLTNAETSIDRVVTGNAGSGKSACILECVDGLRRRHSAVLAFRLDRIEAISSTKELGEGLGLEESPALVLKAAAEVDASEAVLIIDQLDAVSTTSGRSSAFFDIVEDLLEEVQGCRDTVKFHIVLVCRKFDWENDSRFRRLLVDNDKEIPIAALSSEQVSTVLQTNGFKTEWFNTNQLKLLGLPQNLAVFLESNPDPNTRPRFTTNKELYDSYWEVKRRAVNERAGFPDNDPWHEITQELCDEMSASQQLSVMKEKLDRFPEQYVKSMASEGVLSNDEGRYAFSHESFFDYCFARVFVTKNDSLTDFLKASEQHLFRRAQVRQVLEYLRDADLKRYCHELSQLLRDENIRYHLKDLAVALAFRFSDPSEDEWDVFVPWINAEIEAIEQGKKNTEKLAATVWDFFFYSQSWFPLVDRKGLIASWLESENDRLIDKGVKYAEFHQSHAGDRVAELLAPFIDKGDGWQERFYRIMRWPEHGNSRKLFDLFLRSIDNGTLDSVGSRIFGSMGYTAKEQPVWIAEVSARWLRRRLFITSSVRHTSVRGKWCSLFDRDRSGSDDVQSSATNAPEAFVRHVLPVILEISDAAVINERDKPPKRDAVWEVIYETEHPPHDEQFRDAVATALEKLAATKSTEIDSVLCELRNRETLLANHFLLRAYTSGAEHFADDAVTELCKNPWRFECEYPGAPYWLANRLIEAITPYCSNEHRRRLEQVILNYVPDIERCSKGFQWRGNAAYHLLSGVPKSFRSEKATVRFNELERKLGPLSISPPRAIQSGFLESPIGEPAIEKMTDEQWLGAIRKYESDRMSFDRENTVRGGATQLAQRMESCVKEEPERFARLSLRLPAGTNPVYLRNVLTGLKEADVSAELKLDVCRKAHSDARDDCAMPIVGLLGSLEERLPDDAVEMLTWMATQGTGAGVIGIDDDTNMPRGIDRLFTVGLNTTRGHAAIALGDLIRRDAAYVDRFRNTVVQLVKDESVAVRACVAYTLSAIAIHDRDFAFEQFCELLEPRSSTVNEEQLLATEWVERFVSNGLSDYFGRLECIVVHMLRSDLPETRTTGARLASLAVLYKNESAITLVNEALDGDTSQRIGVAQVAARNIGQEKCKEWAEKHLLRFFNDPDTGARQEAASCFHGLHSHPLDQFVALINGFCDSAAFQENPSYLISVLEKTPHHLPSITYVVCEKLLRLPYEEQDQQMAPRSVDVYTVTKVVLKTYHQHQDDEWGSKCLDLIDLMYREKIRDVRIGMEDYER